MSQPSLEKKLAAAGVLAILVPVVIVLAALFVALVIQLGWIAVVFAAALAVALAAVLRRH